MTKLRILSARDMEKLLFKLGFFRVRQCGSHIFYKHSDGRFTTVPHHKGDLKRALIRSILREIDLEIDQFNDYLDRL